MTLRTFCATKLSFLRRKKYLYISLFLMSINHDDLSQAMVYILGTPLNIEVTDSGSYIL
jgi:hypothetical protein